MIGSSSSESPGCTPESIKSNTISTLKEGCHLFDTKRFSQEQPRDAEPRHFWSAPAPAPALGQHSGSGSGSGSE